MRERGWRDGGYPGQVDVFSDPQTTRPVTFRLGFFPWSNPVRLTR